MKTKIYSLLSAAVILGASSCSETWDVPVDQAGELALNTIGIEVSNAEKVISTNGSRSGYDVNDFIVCIRNSQGAAVNTYRFGDMPEIVALPAGTYSVEARSAEKAEKAAWETPYFEGSVKDVVIEANKITSGVEVLCSFASIKVTTSFSDQLKAMLGADANVHIVANDEGALDFSATETRAGYFEALEASNIMVATFSATINGQPFEKRIIFEDVEAGQWRKINFSTQATPSVPQPEGSIDLGNGISINIGYVDTDLTQSGTVGDEEIIENPGRPGVEDPKEPDQPGPDEPGPDQPGDENAISFTYNGEPVEGSTVNDNASGTAYLVVISAEKGMKGLEVEISSDNDDFITSVTELMPLKFNLANPESDELAEALSSIGLPVRDDVVGKPSVDFDISGLVPLLVTFSGEHTFKVTATDADGNSKTLNLVIKS